LEFNVPFQHKYGYIRDETDGVNVVIVFNEFNYNRHARFGVDTSTELDSIV